MKNNRIRLTESQLHRVIKESVKQVLKETIQGGSSASSNINIDNNGRAYAVHQQGGKLGVSNLDINRA